MIVFGLYRAGDEKFRIFRKPGIPFITSDDNPDIINLSNRKYAIFCMLSKRYCRQLCLIAKEAEEITEWLEGNFQQFFCASVISDIGYVMTVTVSLAKCFVAACCRIWYLPNHPSSYPVIQTASGGIFCIKGISHVHA